MKSDEEEEEEGPLSIPRIPRKSSRYGLDVIEESDVVEEGTIFYEERSSRLSNPKPLNSFLFRSVSTGR